MAATSAIIPASGLGRRLGSETDKAFVPLAGRPIIAHTLAVFQDCPEVAEIVLVVRAEQVDRAKRLIDDMAFAKVGVVTAGGDVRQDSVRNGLNRVSPHCDIIAIHDGARPLVTTDIIASSICTALSDGAAIAAVPVIDTIKSSSDGRAVSRTLERQNLYAVQTPQTFRRQIILDAYERAYLDGFYGTDDASLVERMGLSVSIVQGSPRNMKITTPADLAAAEALLDPMRSPASGWTTRVGHSYDVHRLATGRRLFLGGVEFAGGEGLVGHSDADVVLHAIGDAVLGAAGAGDIGRLFPDTDPAYKDVRSTVLLARVGEVVAELGWHVVNIDATVIAERPKIAGYARDMQANIADALGIDPASVNVKASTMEGLGPIGEGQGIECHAVALLVKSAAG